MEVANDRFGFFFCSWKCKKASQNSGGGRRRRKSLFAGQAQEYFSTVAQSNKTQQGDFLP
jgi:hypothetical protein